MEEKSFHGTKEGSMHKAQELGLMGILGVTCLLVQACATQHGSVGGGSVVADEEAVIEPLISHIPPAEFSVRPSRTRPTLHAELVAINDTGLPPGSLSDVLFDFDRATLRPNALPVLESNAHRLIAEGATHLLLEGRGDEIGSSTYNIVLGERRAKNVKTYLQERGLPIQLKTTSYGKDRPLCLQRSSECMQQNRSVHFVVK
jgi:peptidoglycan-associated lipoprotein